MQKPFSGEVLLIDEYGNRSVVEPADPEAGLFSLPDLSLGHGEILAGPEDRTWVLYSKSGRGRLLGGSMKARLPPSIRTGKSLNTAESAGLARAPRAGPCPNPEQN